MKTLDVNLPGAAYPIHIGAGTVESHLRDLVEEHGGDLVVVVTNETLAHMYPRRLEQVLESLPLRVATCTVPDGERFKTFATLHTIYDRLMELQANRSTLLVAFGGGVVGDMAGFAAATFMRGIPLVQVPTTLLAQVDSSVGGKTAINHPQGKNSIGAFKQPRGVVIDLAMLETLPERELRAGLFELIKHGIIRDVKLLEFLEANRERFFSRDWAFWEEAVYRSCQIKAEVVEQDEKEDDLRAILNFGHSLGHLIETHTGYEQVLHGEAVGAGMLFAALVSREMGFIGETDLTRLRELLEPLLLPIGLPPLDKKTFTGLLMHDKKAARHTLKFIMLESVGKAFIRPGTEPEELWPLFGQFAERFPHVLQVSRD